MAKKVRSQGAPKPKKGRARVAYVYRYNPESTSGRAVRVRADSPEAQDWPSRKPSVRVAKLEARARSEIIRTGAAIGKTAIPLAVGVGIRGAARAGRAVAAGGRAAKAALGAAATVGAGTAAAVAGAFAVGYAIGTGLRALWQYLQPEERDYRKALAFRKARQEWAATHGREMTAEEVQAMGRAFKDSLSRSF